MNTALLPKEYKFSSHHKLCIHHWFRFKNQIRVDKDRKFYWSNPKTVTEFRIRSLLVICSLFTTQFKLHWSWFASSEPSYNLCNYHQSFLHFDVFVIYHAQESVGLLPYSIEFSLNYVKLEMLATKVYTSKSKWIQQWGLNPGLTYLFSNSLMTALSRHLVVSLNLWKLYKIMLYWFKKSPKSAVGAWNKVQLRDVLSKTCLLSSVIKALD